MLREKRGNMSKKVIVIAALVIFVPMMMTFSTGCNLAEVIQTDTNPEQEPISENQQEDVIQESSDDAPENIETEKPKVSDSVAENADAKNEELHTYTGIPKLEQEEMYKYLAGCWYRSDDMTKAMSFSQTPDQAFSYVFSQNENGDINIEKYLDGNREARFKILYDDGGKYERKFEIMCAYMSSEDSLGEEAENPMEETIWVKSRNSFDYSEDYTDRLHSGEDIATSQDAITSPRAVSTPGAVSTPEAVNTPGATTTPDAAEVPVNPVAEESTGGGMEPSDAAISQDYSWSN